MKKRIVVFRLFSGGFLRADGNSTYDRTAAVQLLYEDGLRFMLEFRTRDHSDKLHAMSLEVLPKRKGRHHPLSPQEAKELIVKFKTVRILWEADRHDRLAAGYIAQARYFEDMAVKLRVKAEELRKSIEYSAS